MERTELIRALRRMKVETGSLVCLGCGHEHNCSTQGCTIIRAAAEELEKMLWVPVGDATRKPNDSETVIVTEKNRYSPPRVYTTIWHNYDRLGYAPTGFSLDVTHWMPLPEPPGGGKV